MCFIVDACNRRIVGWRVAANMETEVLLDALEMARASRGGRRLLGLVALSDAASQFTSDRFTERLVVIGACPSIGTVADPCDNALAETTNGLGEAEWVYGPDTTSWDDVDELAETDVERGLRSASGSGCEQPRPASGAREGLGARARRLHQRHRCGTDA